MIATATLHAAVVVAALTVAAGALFAPASAVIFGDASEDLVAGVRHWPTLLWNTLVVVALSMVVAVSLGGGLALLGARTRYPGHVLLVIALAWMACLPFHAHVTFLLAIVPVWWLPPSAALCGLIYGLLLAPPSFLLLIPAFSAIETDLEDAARLDARGATVIRCVTLPAAAPALTAVGMLVACFVATDCSVTDILRVRTFAEEVYTQFALQSSAAGPVLTGVPVLVLVAAATWVLIRLPGVPGFAPLEPRPTAARRRNRTATVAGGVALLAVAGAFGVMSIQLVRQIDDWNLALRTFRSLGNTLMNSAVLALVVATVITAAGVGVAWTAARVALVRRFVFFTLCLLLALPAPVLSAGVAAVLNRPGLPGELYDSPFAPMAALLPRLLPIGILLVLPAVRRLDGALYDAARVDGCTATTFLFRFVWPSAKLDAAIAWLILVILGFGDFSAVARVAPPGWPLASAMAFSLLHSGVNRDLAVLAFATSLITLALAGLLLVLFAVRARRAGPRSVRL